MMKNIWNDESGQGMVEYGLILALVSIVAITALTDVGAKIKGVFENVESKLPTTP